jgi:hypothetical protein
MAKSLYQQGTPVVMKKYACTVVSLMPIPITEDKPHMIPANFRIDAAEDGDFSILHVEEGIHYIPNPIIEEGKPGSSFKQTTNPAEMARSICDDFNTAQIGLGEDAGPGLFWLEGRLSKTVILVDNADAIAYYRARQNNWFRSLVTLADNDWEKNKSRIAVSDLQRAAAKALGIRKDWVDLSTQETVNCPMCKSFINPTAVICGFCKYIVKPDLYNKESFANV